MSDKLWQIIEPLLPPEPSKDKGSRPRVPARAVLCGLIYVLKTGIPWRSLPKQLGYGSGVTCWRRLREWQKAGVFILLFRNLLDRLGRCGTIDWSQACVDSATVPAKKGQNVEPNPTDRCKSGSKGHLLTDAAGLPLTVVLTAANVHDCKVFEQLLDTVPPSNRRAEAGPANVRKSCPRTKATPSHIAGGLCTSAAFEYAS